MSARYIVLLPTTGSAVRWRRIDGDGATVGSGVLTGSERADTSGADVTAVAPGSAVAVHWVEMPKATAAQAAAAARHLAAEFVAGSVADQHIAAAAEAGEDGMRAIAIVSQADMQRWLDLLGRYGLDPDTIVPAPLLLPLPADGVATLRNGDMLLARGPRLAVEAEPALAEMMIGARNREVVSRDILDLAATAQLEALVPDLRQGVYRKRGSLSPAIPLRRLVLLAAACMAVFFGDRVAEVLRYEFGARSMQSDIDAIARRALPDTPIDNPIAQMDARLRAASGFTGTAAALFSALQGSGNVRLQTLRYSADGGLRAKIVLPIGANLDSVRSRLAERGLGLVEGASNAGQDGAIVDIEVNRQ